MNIWEPRTRRRPGVCLWEDSMESVPRRTQWIPSLGGLDPCHSRSTLDAVDVCHRPRPSRPQFTHCLQRRQEIPRLSCSHFAHCYCERILVSFFSFATFSADIFLSRPWYKQIRPCLLAVFYLNTLSNIQ